MTHPYSLCNLHLKINYANKGVTFKIINISSLLTNKLQTMYKK